MTADIDLADIDLADLAARLAMTIHRARIAGHETVLLDIVDAKALCQVALSASAPTTAPTASNPAPTSSDHVSITGRRVHRCCDAYWTGEETGSIVDVERTPEGLVERIRVKWDLHCGNKRTWLAASAEGRRWGFIADTEATDGDLP